MEAYARHSFRRLARSTDESGNVYSVTVVDNADIIIILDITHRTRTHIFIENADDSRGSSGTSTDCRRVSFVMEIRVPDNASRRRRRRSSSEGE